jgi:hypothetical protein
MATEDDLPPEVAEEAPDGAQVAEPEANTPEPEASDEDSPTAESLAAELGWSPKDQWRGDPEEWRDAKSFLRTTVDVNKSLRRDLRATREASERAARAAASITERAVAQEREKLLEKRNEAFMSMDVDAFNKADQGLAQLAAHVPQPQEPQETAEFKARNSSWFGKDPIATQMAVNICQSYADQGIVDPATQLSAAEKEIKRRFPEYFAGQQTKQPANVDVSGSRSAAPRKGPKGFDDLPAPAKTAAKDFLRRGRIKSLDEYAKIYFEENA